MCDRQAKILAQAVYEIRILLSGYLGSQNTADMPVRQAAHLAYALHNEALAMLEGGTFDIDAAIAKIRAAERMLGETFSKSLTAEKPNDT